jgi:hypothetical protein
VDPLLLLADLPGVRASIDQARTAIDAVLWNRQIRARAAQTAQYSLTAGARASAAIDGADLVMPDESPMGRVLDAALAVTALAARSEGQWGAAPLQVLAAMHAQVARAMGSSSEPGRPRSTELADDPLRLGALPAAAEVPGRLALLSSVLTRSDGAAALVVAGVVHAELQALRPFPEGSGLIARAAVRCTLAQRGVDPALFTIPELGMSMMGRPAYVAAVRAYLGGTAEQMGEYLVWFAQVCRIGAQVAEQQLDR